MPELLEKGYLYIAQPPLFRIAAGKNEYYVDSEIELNNFLLKRVSDRKTIITNNNEMQITGEDLLIFLDNLNLYFSAISKLEGEGINNKIIDIMINQGAHNKIFIRSKEKMTELEGLIKKIGYKTNGVVWNDEYETFDILFSPNQSKKYVYESQVKIGKDIIYSRSFRMVLDLWNKIKINDYPPFKIYDHKNKDFIIVNDKTKLFEILFNYGKKGIQIQRYKGLGEMNPVQLWHTTMDPQKRRLLKVKVNDIVDSDEIFTILMGDEVEPRRNFIQNNALEVSMLDV